MKQYTVYDNLNGQFTIIRQYYNYSEQKNVRLISTAYTKKTMLTFCQKLESDGYKFVGKL